MNVPKDISEDSFEDVVDNKRRLDELQKMPPQVTGPGLIATERGVEVVHAVACYLWNTSAVRFAAEFFPDSHPEYQREWVERYMEGFAATWGKFDHHNQRRFVQMCLDYAAAIRARGEA